MTTQQTADRRAYFRLADSSYFEFRICGAEEVTVLEEGGFQPPSANEDIQTRLALINRQINPLLNGIRSTQPEVASFLDGLNEKLDLLADQVFFDRFASPNPQMQATRTLDISEYGLSFSSEQPVTPGEYIYARLVIVNFRLGIEAVARVCHCEPLAADEGTEGEGDRYRIGVHLAWLSEAERKQLVRYIMSSQRERRLRSMRQAPEPA